MPEIQEIVIRPMTADDLPMASALSVAEGWNQTGSDWKFFLSNPGNICFAACLGSNITGTAVATVHSSDLAWIGMVLVDRNMRGSGIGKKLMVTTIESLRHIRSVKLDATPAGQPLYAKLGFLEEYLIYRMINPLYSGCFANTSNLFSQRINEESFPGVIKMDEKISGSSRPALLNYLFRNFPERAFLMHKSGEVSGYAFGRKGIRYNYIGPVCSMSEKTAESLLGSALSGLEGSPVVVDIPENQQRMIKILSSSGFEVQRSFMRMYLKNNCRSEPDLQYLISGPEFG